MWNLDKHGCADFSSRGWRLRTLCLPEGIQLAVTHDMSAPSVGSISLLRHPMPVLAESFIRGDELHLSMPPTATTQAGLALALLVVQATQDCFVVESTLSIETLLLDAYPTVVLGLAGEGALVDYVEGSARVFTREPGVVTQEGGAVRQEPGVVAQEGGAVRQENDSNPLGPPNRPPLSVLVDRRDQPSLDVSSGTDPSLRFFADFMEKGVIRKTQPWWVWTSATADPTRVRELVKELAKRPLPLTN